MTQAAELVRQKLLTMDERLRFLEYVWECMHEEEKDFYVNNYQGHIPGKYTK